MLDLLLRHYRGAFDRIYLYSRSASLDKGWDPLRKYVEEVQRVNLDQEQCFFPDTRFTSKGSSGDQRDGTQKTPNPEACQVRRTPGARGSPFFFEKISKSGKMATFE